MTAQLLDTPTGDASGTPQTEALADHWGGIFAMTLCVFALIASEFMPVSLLTNQTNG